MHLFLRPQDLPAPEATQPAPGGMVITSNAFIAGALMQHLKQAKGTTFCRWYSSLEEGLRNLSQGTNTCVALDAGDLSEDETLSILHQLSSRGVTQVMINQPNLSASTRNLFIESGATDFVAKSGSVTAAFIPALKLMGV